MTECTCGCHRARTTMRLPEAFDTAGSRNAIRRSLRCRECGHDGQVEFITDAVPHVPFKSTERYATNWTDWRAIYGTTASPMRDRIYRIRDRIRCAIRSLVAALERTINNL